MLKDIDNLTDANQGLKRALDEAQQEVRVKIETASTPNFVARTMKVRNARLNK
jgi:hypothetical protein